MRRTLAELLLLFVVTSVFGGARALMFTTAGERIVARLRQRLFAHLVGQDVAFFDSARTGELTSRLSADTGILQTSVTANISMALRHFVQAVGSLGFLFAKSAVLTGWMLVVVPLVSVGAVFFSRFIRRLSRATQDALAQATMVAEESLSNIRTVKSFVREGVQRQRYNDAVEQSFRLGVRTARGYGLFVGAMSLAGYGAFALVLWFGVGLVARNELSVGQLTAFVTYTFYLGFALASLSGLYGDFNRALGASERVFELLDAPAKVFRGDGRTSVPAGAGLRFDSVTFAYPTRADQVVLNDFSIDIRAGEVVALVGASGAGKSTVAQLLCRYYDPQSGTVQLGGSDVREFQTDWLREQIGVVAQEPALFAASIEENIRYGRPGASDADVQAAATAARAHEFILSFRDGYRTVVGERGVRLSGGQRQRIAIARALLKDPQFLILDEATSALDAENEHLVQAALSELIKGRTVLVIAHRLSTVRRASWVGVMDGGRLVERGTHDELMEKKGAYYQLIQRQFVNNELGAP